MVSRTSASKQFKDYVSNSKGLSSITSFLFSTCTKTETVQTALIIYNNSWASFEVSLQPESLAIELEWTIGPIAIDDGIGKEVILRYDTDIESDTRFYTDANGREVLQRTRDYRPTWNYTITEPVSGNYYPVTSRIWIKDDTRQFTILTGNHCDNCSVILQKVNDSV